MTRVTDVTGVISGRDWRIDQSGSGDPGDADRLGPPGRGEDAVDDAITACGVREKRSDGKLPAYVITSLTLGLACLGWQM